MSAVKRQHESENAFLNDIAGSNGDNGDGRDGSGAKVGRKLSADIKDKRTQQNRAAQRAFRERKEMKLKELESKVESLEKINKRQEIEQQLLVTQLNVLLAELSKVKGGNGAGVPPAALGTTPVSASTSTSNSDVLFDNTTPLSSNLSFNGMSDDENGFNKGSVSSTNSNAMDKDSFVFPWKLKDEQEKANTTSSLQFGLENRTEKNMQKNNNNNKKFNGSSSSNSLNDVFDFNGSTIDSNSITSSINVNLNKDFQRQAIPSPSSISSNSSSSNNILKKLNDKKNENNMNIDKNELNNNDFDNDFDEQVFCTQISQACPYNPSTTIITTPQQLSTTEDLFPITQQNSISSETFAQGMIDVEKTKGSFMSISHDNTIIDNNIAFDTFDWDNLIGTPQHISTTTTTTTTAASNTEFTTTNATMNDVNPLIVDPFELHIKEEYDEENDKDEEEEEEGRADDSEVVPSTDGKLLNCSQVWERVTTNPRYTDIDIDGLCSELKLKAKCSERGAVIKEHDFQKVLQGNINH